MAELKVGLAPNRTSYYDKVTNTYITLQAPVQTVYYDENDMAATVTRLEKIVHALFASVPALRLYEGKVPEECIEHWKSKYMKPFNTDVTKLMRDLKGNIVPPVPNRAFDRPDKINDASVDNDGEVEGFQVQATVETPQVEDQKVEEQKVEKTESKKEEKQEEEQQDLLNLEEEEKPEEKKEQKKETKSKTKSKTTSKKTKKEEK